MVSSTTKIVLLSTCLAAMLTAAYLHHSLKPRAQTLSAETAEEYVRWQAKYKPGLTMTPDEQNYRMRVFVNSKAHVQQKNEEYNRRVIEEDLPKPTSPMYELNQFADLSDEEFESQYLGGSLPSQEEEEEISPLSDLYKRVQETKGDIKQNLGADHSYNVYNQGSCGSCWSFASVNLAERKWFTTQQSKINLSQQQLVDCDTSCNGCNGGLISKGMTYINNYGVTTASSYPYKASVGACQVAGKSLYLRGVFNVQTYTFNLQGVANWIKAGHYAGGRVNGGALRYVSATDNIFAPSATDCQNRVNHAIILIEASSSENWVTMLNSWGTTWGLNGIKKIRPCGIDNYAGAGAQFYTY